jgi:hypothetical protein
VVCPFSRSWFWPWILALLVPATLPFLHDKDKHEARRALFDQVQPGMTEEEVAALLGPLERSGEYRAVLNFSSCGRSAEHTSRYWCATEGDIQVWFWDGLVTAKFLETPISEPSQQRLERLVRGLRDWSERLGTRSKPTPTPRRAHGCQKYE